MTIAFIPVRGGSKSIPLKNIKHFCGKPLVYWTVKALENCYNVGRTRQEILAGTRCGASILLGIFMVIMKKTDYSNNDNNKHCNNSK